MTKYYDDDEELTEEEFESIIESVYTPEDYILRIGDLCKSYEKQLVVKILKYDDEEIFAVVQALTKSEVRLKIDNPAELCLRSFQISEIRDTQITERKDLNNSPVIESPFEKPLEDK